MASADDRAVGVGDLLDLLADARPGWHADAFCRWPAGPPCSPVSRMTSLCSTLCQPEIGGKGLDVERAELAEAAIVLRRLLDAVEAGRVEVDTSGVGLGPREVALLRSLAERIMQSVRERASGAAGEMSSLVEPAQADELPDDLQLDANALWAQATGRLP